MEHSLALKALDVLQNDLNDLESRLEVLESKLDKLDVHHAEVKEMLNNLRE